MWMSSRLEMAFMSRKANDRATEQGTVDAGLITEQVAYVLPDDYFFLEQSWKTLWCRKINLKWKTLLDTLLGESGNTLKAFTAAETANADYRDESDKWEERRGEKEQRQEKESVYKRLENYQRENTDRHIRQTSKTGTKEPGKRLWFTDYRW